MRFRCCDVGTSKTRRSRPGVSTVEAAEVRALRRKVSELERTIAILTEATRLFAREADPLRR
jgi:transposase